MKKGDKYKCHQKFDLKLQVLATFFAEYLLRKLSIFSKVCIHTQNRLNNLISLFLDRLMLFETTSVLRV